MTFEEAKEKKEKVLQESDFGQGVIGKPFIVPKEEQALNNYLVYANANFKTLTDETAKLYGTDFDVKYLGWRNFDIFYQSI